MKRFGQMVLCAGLLLPFLWAQEDTLQVEGDAQVYTLPPSPKKAKWGWQSYQEIAYNQLLGIPDTLRNSVEGLGSIKINLSWLPHLRIGSAFYVGLGFGLAIRETRFEEPVSLFRTADNRLGYAIDSLPESVRAKSKLQLGYFRIPLEIGILYKKFNFAVFGYGEALLSAKHKRKYRDNEGLSRAIFYGNRIFHTEPFQYGVGARIGYKGIGVFATYNLSTLWQAQKGPANVRAMQAGLYFFETLQGKKSSKKTRLTATSF